MKDVAIIAPCRLPVFGQKGGAVEQLIARIVHDNEEMRELNIDLFTIEGDKESDTDLGYTHVIEVRQNALSARADKVTDKIYRSLSGLSAHRLLDTDIVKTFGRRLSERKRGYDAVIVENHMSTGNLLTENYVSRIGGPIYFHMHNDLDTYRSPSYIKKLTDHGTQFISVSRYIRDRILKYSPDAVVHILYNGTDPLQFDKKAIREDKEFRFLYAGRIIPGKGVKELITAFMNFIGELDDKEASRYKLDIVGFSDTPYKYEEEVKRLASTGKDNIQCIRKVSPGDMDKIYRGCDAVVMPSVKSETFGLVALETMAMGIPLIVSDAGALSEVVGDGALVVKISKHFIRDLTNAMKEISGSEELRKKLSERAYTRAREIPEFNIKNYYRGLTGILKKVPADELVSVIVPVYNVEGCLERCVSAICGQTYKNLEIILVDDGSTDASGKICDRVSALDARIRVIHQENMGLSGARNTGLDNAKGEYVFFCDSDDLIEPETIDELLRTALTCGADISACGISHIYDDYFEGSGREDAFTSEVPGRWSGRVSTIQMMRSNNVCSVAWNKLYKRYLFEGVRYPVGVYNEDEATTYKLLYKAGIVTYTPERFYKYYQRSSSIMHTDMKKRYRDFIRAFSDREAYFREKKDDELLQHSRVTLLDGIKYAYRSIDDKAIRKKLALLYSEKINLRNAPKVLGVKKKAALLLWKYIKY